MSEDEERASHNRDWELLEARRRTLAEERRRDRALYSDSFGLPVLRPSYVVYIDVLGTKEALRKLSDADLQTVIDERDRFLVRLHNPGMGRWGRMVSFTDNVVYGEPTRRPERGGLLRLGAAIAEYQNALTARGRLLRGGLVRGDLYIDSTFATGKGLLHAIDLEENRAIFPRVLLSRNVLPAIEEEADALCPADSSPHNQYFVVDDDGEVFVNYLAAGWPNIEVDHRVSVSRKSLGPHTAMLQEALKEHSEPGRVRDKYLWAAHLHNWLCGETGQKQWTIQHGLTRWEQAHPRRFEWFFGRPPRYPGAS